MLAIFYEQVALVWEIVLAIDIFLNFLLSRLKLTRIKTQPDGGEEDVLIKLMFRYGLS